LITLFIGELREFNKKIKNNQNSEKKKKIILSTEIWRSDALLYVKIEKKSKFKSVWQVKTQHYSSHWLDGHSNFEFVFWKQKPCFKATVLFAEISFKRKNQGLTLTDFFERKLNDLAFSKLKNSLNKYNAVLVKFEVWVKLFYFVFWCFTGVKHLGTCDLSC
jgi:hypothetical protein